MDQQRRDTLLGMTDPWPHQPASPYSPPPVKWTLLADSTEVRVFARPLPPLPLLVIAALLVAAQGVGLVYFARRPETPDFVPWVAGLAFVLADIGVFGISILLQASQSARGDLVRFDAGARSVELPRAGRTIPQEAIACLLYVAFTGGASHSRLRVRQPCLVLGPATSPEIVPIILNAGQRRLWQQLAMRLVVPFERLDLPAQYDLPRPSARSA